MKLVLCLLSILSIFISMPVYGQDFIRRIEPIVYKGIVLIPTRQFAKNLNFSVQVENNSIKLVSALTTIQLGIGSKQIAVDRMQTELAFPILTFADSSFLPAKEMAKLLDLEYEVTADVARVGEALFPLRHDKQILIVISTQKIFCYEDNFLVMQSLVSTARKGRHNHLGIFQIGRKVAGPVYDKPYSCWLRYTMQFYGHHLMHGWPSKSAKTIADPGGKIGHPASNGCVRLYNDFAKDLYKWAPVGTSVEIVP